MTPSQAERLWTEVVVVNCGGTINMDGGAGAAPGAGVLRLFDRLGAGFDRARLRLVTPFSRPPDSSNVGADEWAVVVEQIRQIDKARRGALRVLQARGHDTTHRGGVVVAHGTDTMQITSMVAALEVASDGLVAPVVFTGAHSPPEVPGSDAVNNLAKAIYAATRRPEEIPHNLPPGVYVLIGEDIHMASRLTKVSSQPDADGRYFFSFPGPVAQMTSKDFGVKLNQGLLDALQRGWRATALPRRVHPWGYVEHLVLDAFVDPGVLSDLGQRCREARAGSVGRRAGVVVQGDFRNHKDLPAILGGLADLLHDEVVIALGSRKAAAALSEHGLGRATCLLPRSLSHGAARLKLSWLLGTDAPLDWMPALLGTSLVGEVFDTDALPGWIKYETFPDQRDGVLVVPAWPDLAARVVEDAAARVGAATGAVLHLYGFGHGHLPGPNRPIGELAGRWLADSLPRTTEALRSAGLPDRLPSRLGEAVVALSDALRGAWATPSARGTVAAELRAAWSVDDRLATQALRNSLAAGAQAALEARLRTELRDTVEQFAARNGEIRARRTDRALDAFVDVARFSLPLSALEARRVALLGGVGVAGDLPLLDQLCVVAPAVVARRVVKDAVMASSPLLHAVGAAIDRGVRVEIHSQAMRGVSDISRYETGNLLLALGAKADEGPWWRAEGLTPRSTGGRR